MDSFFQNAKRFKVYRNGIANRSPLDLSKFVFALIFNATDATNNEVRR